MADVDVLIVGSGYTGLHCALQTASAGLSTQVVDAGVIGGGCSTRNGGQISGEIKPGLAELGRRFGAEEARAMVLEARAALEWLGDFVADNGIECEYRRCGRFLAAHSPRQFRQLCAQARNQPRGLERSLQPVGPGEQRNEIASDYYHGGLLIEDHCSVDPARYHRGLLDLARARGAAVIGSCRAGAIERQQDGFRVLTERGAVTCRRLLIATNGYTDGVAPWQRRRVIPIGSYMLATEPLAEGLAERLLPGQRVYSDTRRVVVYFRRSPDGQRILFGGRVSVFEADPVMALPALREELLRLFPELENTPISHAWMGFVAYTFDHLPHLGREDGIDYAMGYCGSGVSLASHFGHRVGRAIVAGSEIDSAFTRGRFQTRPLYRGKPWFLAPAVSYYQWRDRFS
ncbi:MAG: FAD-binding oxidoreductase [Gammaproteobacteria bacterium]|nr:FAD-binding oxidoreductase [Gammaproteobacteria bacterium]